MDVALGLIVGFVVGIAATDYWWFKYFQRMGMNIRLILDAKTPTAAGRKTT